MANPWAGEVEIMLDGVAHRARLTLGALAELEAAIGESGGMVTMVERFEAGRCTARDILAVIVAGLRGGGWQGSTEDLRSVEIGGGPVVAASKAAELLARAFTLPGQGAS